MAQFWFKSVNSPLLQLLSVLISLALLPWVIYVITSSTYSIHQSHSQPIRELKLSNSNVMINSKSMLIMNQSIPSIISVSSSINSSSTMIEDVTLDSIHNTTEMPLTMMNMSVDENDDQQSLDQLVLPIPFVVGKMLYRGNYYHSFQRLVRGLVDLSNIMDIPDSSMKWHQIRLIWNGPSMTDTLKIHQKANDPRTPVVKVAQKIFEFFDGRFNENGTFINNINVSNNNNDDKYTTDDTTNFINDQFTIMNVSEKNKLLKMQKNKVKSMLNHRRFWLRPLDERAGQWIQLFAHHKFGIVIPKYNHFNDDNNLDLIDDDEQKKQKLKQKNREDQCKDQFSLLLNNHTRNNDTNKTTISVLLVSRLKGQRRRFDLSKLALKMKQSLLFDKVTHIKDLSSLTIKKQAELYSNHLFSIQPHGAGETNLIFANGPHQSKGPPHIAIELATPYSDCIECQPYGIYSTYRNLIPYMWIFSVGTESPMMNCTQFCQQLKHSNEKGTKIRTVLRDHQVPSELGLNQSIKLINKLIHTYLIPHCMGHYDYPNTMNHSQPLRALTLPFKQNTSRLRRFKEAYKKLIHQNLPDSWH